MFGGMLDDVKIVIQPERTCSRFHFLTSSFEHMNIFFVVLQNSLHEQNPQHQHLFHFLNIFLIDRKLKET